MSIASLPFGFDVGPLRKELEEQSQAWDEYPWRTEHPRSPHRECSDIWLRYNALENLGDHFNDKHESVWYPIADKLPTAKRISQTLSDIRVQPLAGVLITKVPARAQVYPHIDKGWHAESTDKIGVLVKGNRMQRFCFEDASYGCDEGRSFVFSNQAAHWVLNETPEDRITLIVCLRRVQ